MTDVMLLVGPPGTGKTRELAKEAAKAGAEYGGSDVVICSLTRTAAAEIAERTDVPDENVGTLHAHAFRALNRPDLAETSEGLKAWAEDHPGLRLTGGRGNLDDVDATQVIDDTGKTHADELHQGVMNHRARMTAVEEWSEAEQDYWRTWHDWKQQTGRLDFTDLIERAIAETDKHPQHPRTLLGDEAQDFSALELALFRRWATGAEHAVIAADPDQTIYAWRGSDPAAFQRIPDENVRILGQSYRLPIAIHNAATTWIRQIADRRHAPYLPRDAAGDAGQSPVALAQVDPLLEQLVDNASRGETTMLLTSCTYMLQPALQVLKDAGIPFHNPLRPTQGAWNPLRGGRRLAAFLRPREDVWGKQARLWTWDDLRLWTEPLSARDSMARGFKSHIEEKCREDKLGYTRANDEVPTETLCKIFDDPGSLRHPVFKLDVDWWASKLRAKTRDQMAYPLDVYRSRGGAALLEKPKVIVGTVHSVKGGECSPPDEPVLTTNRGWVPIGELDPEADRLVSFNSDHHKIHRGGPRRPNGYRFTKNDRAFIGDLLTLDTGVSTTRVTPNHHLTVRWAKEAIGAHCVYIARRGRHWRIGVTTLITCRGGRHMNGLLARARRDGAEAVWVVDVCSTRAEAIALERELAWTYGIPDITFTISAHEIVTQSRQDAIWDTIDSVTGAARLLNDRGLHPDWPLCTLRPDGMNRRQGGLRNRWLTRAANLLPGFMELPTDPGRGQTPDWRSPTVSREPYEGTVWSLSVERWKHYISGAAVVHNCDHVLLAPDLSKAAMYQGWLAGGPAREHIVRTFYVGCTRARQSLTVLTPSCPEHVPVDQLLAGNLAQAVAA